MDFYSLSILTLEESIFTGTVYSLTAPGTKGSFQVLAHHAPLLSSLQQGKLEVTTDGGQKHVYLISGGLIKVAKDHTIIFADDIEVVA